MRIDGRQLVTAWHEHQEDAAAALAKLKTAGAPAKAAEQLTLGAALEGCRQEFLDRAEDRKKAEGYWLKNQAVHARYLLLFWSPETRVAGLDRRQVEWFIKLSLAEQDEDGAPKKPRAAKTLIEKDLYLLKLVFKLAGVAWPEPKNVPEKNIPLTHFFTPEEAMAVVDRVRNEVFRDSRGKVIVYPERELHADVIELVLFTAVRVGELSRIRLEDVELGRQRIMVRKPKVKGALRWLMIPTELMPAVKRLVARAEKAGRWTLLPQGVVWASQQVFTRWKERLKEPRLSGRTLRHTAITAALAAGATLPEVAALSGHLRVTTIDKYAHALRQSQGETAGKLAAKLRDAARQRSA